MAAGKQNLVGGRVRKLRTTAGLSQESLAARCGAAGWDVSRGTFAKIEAGLRRVNDAELLILAKALRCTVGDLLEGFPAKAIADVLRQGEAGG
ncbi:helix-turn-helix transcriptional regulator [Haloferula sp. BvORR071]|uniref:helix-turn-helix domain-containing protein n=1 Tax=Haloferula sp. BvORR071 TaxID=1396141 RepID=UPI0005586BAE|nr:helix-turn-helix transcriptional regulator [Haloferula sp. BvORR071]